MKNLKYFLPHIISIAMFSAIVGSGFSIWYFVSSSESTSAQAEVDIALTNVVTNNGLSAEFTKDYILIGETSTQIDGAHILINYDISDDTDPDHYYDFIYTVKATLEPIDSSKDCLNSFIYASDVFDATDDSFASIVKSREDSTVETYQGGVAPLYTFKIESTKNQNLQSEDSHSLMDEIGIKFSWIKFIATTDEYKEVIAAVNNTTITYTISLIEATLSDENDSTDDSNSNS